ARPPGLSNLWQEAEAAEAAPDRRARTDAGRVSSEVRAQARLSDGAARLRATAARARAQPRTGQAEEAGASRPQVGQPLNRPDARSRLSGRHTSATPDQERREPLARSRDLRLRPTLGIAARGATSPPIATSHRPPNHRARAAPYIRHPLLRLAQRNRSTPRFVQCPMSNRSGYCRGCARRDWSGALIRAPKWAAACQGQRGLQGIGRA